MSMYVRESICLPGLSAAARVAAAGAESAIDSHCPLVGIIWSLFLCIPSDCVKINGRQILLPCAHTNFPCVSMHCPTDSVKSVSPSIIDGSLLQKIRWKKHKVFQTFFCRFN